MYCNSGSAVHNRRGMFKEDSKIFQWVNTFTIVCRIPSPLEFLALELANLTRPWEIPVTSDEWPTKERGLAYLITTFWQIPTYVKHDTLV